MTALRDPGTSASLIRDCLPVKRVDNGFPDSRTLLRAVDKVSSDLFYSPLCLCTQQVCRLVPLLNYKLSPAVLLEAVFTIVGAERALFSVADYFNTVALNTAGDQSATGGFCALHPERNIVFCRTSLICVASDRDPNTG